MGFGFATAQAERVVAGGRAIEVARMKITEARSAGSLTPHAIQIKSSLLSRKRRTLEHHR
jgi:hypothetical protein